MLESSSARPRSYTTFSLANDAEFNPCRSVFKTQLQDEAAIKEPTMTAPQPELSTAQIRSRNPLLLNAAQEAEVRELYHKRVRSYCADEIRGMAPVLEASKPVF